jgi:tRNA (Thr-GGU) A37 N-methylase
MNNEITINPIGYVKKDEQGIYVQLKPEFITGLTAIEGFNYLQLVWWAHLYANTETRAMTVYEKPYKKGPEKIGVFATRSQIRPNPICLSPMPVQHIDYEKGIIRTWWIDCEVDTPVLDIKPYHPCSDRINDVSVPQWCDHWPKSYEESGSFDWEAEFNF